MYQEDRGTPLTLEAGLEHVHPDPVDVVDEPRADAARKDVGTEWHQALGRACGLGSGFILEAEQ